MNTTDSSTLRFPALSTTHTKTTMLHRFWSVAIGAILTFSAAAQSPGSITPSDITGQPSNIFLQPGEVHIIGGPRAGAVNPIGLEDGLYYYQVTDLSGETLLSAEPIADRWAEVSGGRFVASSKYPHGFVGAPFGPGGSLLVPVSPFFPDPTGEYRVWFIGQEAYEEGGPQNGFEAIRSKSATFIVSPDGLPVPAQTEICGFIYYDFTESGDIDQFDPGNRRDPFEVPLGNWLVRLNDEPPVPADIDGFYSFFVETNPNATHRITSLVPREQWVGEDGGRWAPTTFLPAVQGSPQIALISPDVPKKRADFGILFMVNTPGLGQDEMHWGSSSGGTTLWACEQIDENHNGVADWREAVNSMNLRWNFTVADFNWFRLRPFRPDETRFKVSYRAPFFIAFAQLRFYLNLNDRGVLAYRLSRSVCATVLNATCGNLQTTVFVDSPQTPPGVLESLDSMLARVRTLLGDDCAANSGPILNPAYPECIQTILDCLTEWGGINSDGAQVFTKAERAPTVKYRTRREEEPRR